MKGIVIPNYYLSDDVEQLDEHWNKEHIFMTVSSQTHIKNIVPRFEALFHLTFNGVSTHMANGYYPKIDKTPLCLRLTLQVSGL